MTEQEDTSMTRPIMPRAHGKKTSHGGEHGSCSFGHRNHGDATGGISVARRVPVSGIHVSPGTPAPDRSVVELPELRRYIEGFGRPDDACMVARAGLPNGPQIVGAAWARIFPNNSAGYGTIDTATPEVSISLLPDWRNRGIGHRLMTALLDRLRTDGHAAASLSVQRTNANALHLYESLGFTIISEHDGELVMRVALAD